MTLYDRLNMKAKNSVLKSVFIKENVRYCGESGYTHFTVECYDETFENAMYRDEDKLQKYIINKAKKYIGHRKAFITFYSTVSGQFLEIVI
jgi:hypothetical protein